MTLALALTLTLAPALSRIDGPVTVLNVDNEVG